MNVNELIHKLEVLRDLEGLGQTEVFFATIQIGVLEVGKIEVRNFTDARMTQVHLKHP